MTQKPHGNKPIPFADEYKLEAARIMRQRHNGIEPSETLILSGELAQGYSIVRIELTNDTRTEQLWFEVCVECEPNDITNPIEARDKAVDFADTLLEEYLINEHMVRFTPDWQSLDDGLKVLLRGERINPKALAEADAFLAAHGFDEHGHPKG